MEFSVLFPYRATFWQLGLSKKWWHRLAVALFTATLVLVLLLRISEAADDYDIKNGEFSSESLEFIHQEVKPDHRISPAQRRALTNYFDRISANVNHEADDRLWWDFLLSFGLLTSLSYILQSLYAAIIWVVYRDKLRLEPLRHKRA